MGVETVSYNTLLEAYANDLYALASDQSIGENEKLYNCFLEMENAFAEIYRKFSPGPRMYSSVAQFDADVENFRKKFSEHEEHRVQNLLVGFCVGFEKARKTLEKRCARPKLAFGF